MNMISSGIKKFGFSKWFKDKVDPNDLNSFEIARVMAVPVRMKGF